MNDSVSIRRAIRWNRKSYNAQKCFVRGLYRCPSDRRNIENRQWINLTIDSVPIQRLIWWIRKLYSVQNWLNSGQHRIRVHLAEKNWKSSTDWSNSTKSSNFESAMLEFESEQITPRYVEASVKISARSVVYQRTTATITITRSRENDNEKTDIFIEYYNPAGPLYVNQTPFTTNSIWNGPGHQHLCEGLK